MSGTKNIKHGKWQCSFHLPSFWCEPQIIKEKARWRSALALVMVTFCLKLVFNSNLLTTCVIVMFISPQTWQNARIMLLSFDSERCSWIILVKVLFEYFSPCQKTSPAQSYSCPTAHGCSQPACPEPSPSEVAWQSADKEGICQHTVH